MSDTTTHIALVGFMGAGKTTVGRALAARLEQDFVDLDNLIEEFSGREIRSIIDADGEAIFRLVETDVLRLLLDAPHDRPLVIATGGGTWAREENRRLMHAHGCHTVWLDAPFDLCWERAVGDGDTRPLARDRRRAHTLFRDRLVDYGRAGSRIPVAPEHAVTDIVEMIRRRHDDPLIETVIEK